MEIRTDLAIEHPAFTGNAPLPRGTFCHRENRHGIAATVVEIKSHGASRALGKPRGTYITLDLTPVIRREKDSSRRAVLAIGEYLRELLQLPAMLPVLVAGLGNREVTPDAVGPMTADRVLVTRHMLQKMPLELGTLRPVSALVPGVLGTTGVESAETVRALTERTGAAAVIAVDAIAARDTGRLLGTVQLSDSGIAPGSGLGQGRCALDRELLGVPVMAVGIPTITDAAAMAADLFQRTGVQIDEDRLRQVSTGMMVTCCDIDRRVREASALLARAINFALQPGLTMEDLDALTAG